MLACFGSDRRAQVSGVLGNFRKVQSSEGSHLAQALDSPILAEWDNPEPSIQRYLWLSGAGCPTGEIACAGKCVGRFDPNLLGVCHCNSTGTVRPWRLCVHQGVCRHTAFMALQKNLQYNLVKWGWERSTSFGNKQQSQSKCCALWASSRKVLFGLARFWWSTLLHNGYFVIKMHPGLESEVLAFCGELIEFCSLRMEQSQMEHINHLFGVSELYQSTCLNSFPFGSSIETKE